MNALAECFPKAAALLNEAREGAMGRDPRLRNARLSDADRQRSAGSGSGMAHDSLQLAGFEGQDAAGKVGITLQRAVKAVDRHR